MYDVLTSSNKLMELFENNSKEVDGEHLVSEEGLTEMSELFVSVPLDSRADVFIGFLDMLHEGGYAFNMEQFSQVHDEPDPEDREIITEYDEDVIRFGDEDGMLKHMSNNKLI